MVMTRVITMVMTKVTTYRRDFITRSCILREISGPGRELALSPEAGELLPGPDEDVLRQGIGVLRVTTHARAKRVNTTDMGPVNALERVGVARLSPADHAVHQAHLATGLGVGLLH